MDIIHRNEHFPSLLEYSGTTVGRIDQNGNIENDYGEIIAYRSRTIAGSFVDINGNIIASKGRFGIEVNRPWW